MNYTNVYDLDGTLSVLNNTFDFILSYHVHKNNKLRIFFVKNIIRVVRRMPFVQEHVKRRFYIFIYFFGLKTANLENFFELEYKYVFLNHLTDLGNKLYKDKDENFDKILLTGCTAVPARQITNLFQLPHLICTEFVTYKGMIFFCKTDTFGNKKIKPLVNLSHDLNIPLRQMRYYTDDQYTEDELIKKFGKVELI